jgi:hypothetical protein
MRKDLGFRVGTGLFGLVLILIVAAIGFELARQSMLSIQKFGPAVLAHLHVGPGVW